MTIQENLIIEVDKISKEMIILINNTDFEDKNNLKENNRNMNSLIDRLKDRKRIYSDKIAEIVEKEKISGTIERDNLLADRLKTVSLQRIISVIKNQVENEGLPANESGFINERFNKIKHIKDKDFRECLTNFNVIQIMKKEYYNNFEIRDIVRKIFFICERNNLL
tara:strand:- start:2772 stop:3269 length:498 start_codon:yes stop_codon:yes gene_type:complete